MVTTPKWDRVFIDFSCSKLEQLTERICDCLDKLDRQQIWFRGTENENAVGNLVLHLCGNVRQWIGFGIGGRPDDRQRDLEFSRRSGVEADELKDRLRRTVAEAVAILKAVEPSQLLESRKIQKYEMPALEAIYHVVEHFSGHAGQIIFSTKQFTGRDLRYYAHLNSPQAPDRQTP